MHQAFVVLLCLDVHARDAAALERKAENNGCTVRGSSRMQEMQRNLKQKAPTPYAGEPPGKVANEQSQKIEEALKDIPPAA